MKRSTLILLVLISTNLCLANEPQKWELMQRAILVDQDLEKIKSLVASGVDPSAPIGCGTYAPLDGAIQQENLEMVALLLSLGAKPRGDQVVTAAFCRSPGVATVIVRKLHEAGASVNGREDYPPEAGVFTNAIHRAVWRGNNGLVAYLLRQKEIELNNPDVDNRTPLMIAVEKNNWEIVKMLLDAGADPKAKNRKGDDVAAISRRVIHQHESFVQNIDK
jgi:ankyrin repeat protein